VTAVRAEVFTPEGEGPWPALVVVSEVWGLNDDMRRIGRRFAAEGYLAVLPDLYEGRASVRCMVKALWSLRTGRGPAVDGLRALVTQVASRDDATAVGVVGFCMGGGYALLLGTTTEARVAGVYYGALSSATDWDALCPVVGGYGARDLSMRAGHARLKRELAARDVPHDLVLYPGVGHSYMNEEAAGFMRVLSWPVMRLQPDPAAAEDSWQRMLSFFAVHLVPGEVTSAP